MQFIVNKNIRRILKQKGIQQKDAATRAGLGEMTFSNIVNCRRKVYADELVRIATALECSINDLVKQE